VLELITKWDKEKEYYDKAVIDPKTNTTWPYLPSTNEIAYRNWLKDVIDPASEKLYTGKFKKVDVSDDGKETETLIDMEAYEEIYAIYRIRRDDGKEFLLSKGRLIGFNEFGKPKTYPYSYKEMYSETVFHYETDKDQNTGKLRQFCHGPERAIDHYLMPFTPGNVDKLWNKRDKKRCQLAVKENISGEAKECLNLEMFKTKDFDYIMNMGYLTEKERAERLEEFQTLQGQLPQKTKK
jgi:hypothetical protein